MLFVGGFRSRWFIITIGTIVVIWWYILGLYFLKKTYLLRYLVLVSFIEWIEYLTGLILVAYNLLMDLPRLVQVVYLDMDLIILQYIFPEMQTDFIFAVFASKLLVLRVIGLLLLIVYFDISIVKLGSKSYNNNDKLLTGGIISVLLFQQIHNISMTIGLLPIMGITLPFISYGGSSLLSYMILIGMLFNISNENLRFKKLILSFLF